MKRLTIFLLAVGGLPVVLWANGADLYQGTGVRALSMAGAYLAIASTNDALYVNPAGLGRFKRLEVDAEYVYHWYQPEHVMGASVVDSTQAPWSAGVNFLLTMDHHQGDQYGYAGSAAFAYEAIDEALFVGALVKYNYIPATQAAGVNNAFSSDIGLLADLGHNIRLSLVGANLIPSDSERLPLSVGIGAAVGLGQEINRQRPEAILDGFDVAVAYRAVDLAKGRVVRHELSAGFSSLMWDVAWLSAGYRFESPSSQHTTAVGLGALLWGVSLSGVFEQNWTDQTQRILGASMQVFL